MGKKRVGMGCVGRVGGCVWLVRGLSRLEEGDVFDQQ